mmetsp:Transcript_3824/g.8195  ORF Transcript_3824/g.8195 Transcript_3824/m.8195 type:complete len:136 (-) Transcript_3824:7-414(-)
MPSYIAASRSGAMRLVDDAFDLQDDLEGLSRRSEARTAFLTAVWASQQDARKLADSVSSLGGTPGQQQQSKAGQAVQSEAAGPSSSSGSSSSSASRAQSGQGSGGKERERRRRRSGPGQAEPQQQQGLEGGPPAS